MFFKPFLFTFYDYCNISMKIGSNVIIIIYNLWKGMRKLSNTMKGVSDSTVILQYLFHCYIVIPNFVHS